MSHQIKVEVEIPKDGAEGILILSLDETLDCGEDTGTPVCESYQVPFKFTGSLKHVTIELGPLLLGKVSF